MYARVCDLADLARVVHLPWLLVERLIQPHGGLRRGQVDEAVAHIALVAAFLFYFIYFLFCIKKKPTVKQARQNSHFMLEQEIQNGMARRNKQLTEEQTTKDLLELRHTPSNQKKKTLA